MADHITPKELRRLDAEAQRARDALAPFRGSVEITAERADATIAFMQAETAYKAALCSLHRAGRLFHTDDVRGMILDAMEDETAPRLLAHLLSKLPQNGAKGE